MSYRKKITLAFLTFSLILTSIYSILIWGTLFTTEDQLYKHLLEQYYTKAYEGYDDEANNNEPLISRAIYTKESLPEHLKDLPTGFSESENSYTLIKPLANDRLLFLTLPEADNLIDKIEPLILLLLFLFSLIITLFGAILAFILAKQLSTPIERLVKEVKEASPEAENICKEGSSHEINMLARSFNEAMLQIKTALKREKSFTESVSHELRTPLMVLNTNVDILKSHKEPLTVMDRALDRMSRAMNNMSNLTNIFLILARHDKFTIEKERLIPINIIRSYIETNRQQTIIWDIQCPEGTSINAPTDIFGILVSNLIDNANKYAEEKATLIVTNNHLETYNNINESSRYSNSSKLGINIIERICYALDWKLVYKMTDSTFSLRIDFITSS